MIRFIVQRHEQDHNSGLERRDFVTLDASVPELEQLLRKGGRGEVGFEHYQLLGAELLEPAPDALPYWEPCNPGCDPELNGARSNLCACDQAKAAWAGQPQRTTVAGIPIVEDATVPDDCIRVIITPDASADEIPDFIAGNGNKARRRALAMGITRWVPVPAPVDSEGGHCD